CSWRGWVTLIAPSRSKTGLEKQTFFTPGRGESGVTPCGGVVWGVAGGQGGGGGGTAIPLLRGGRGRGGCDRGTLGHRGRFEKRRPSHLSGIFTHSNRSPQRLRHSGLIPGTTRDLAPMLLAPGVWCVVGPGAAPWRCCSSPFRPCCRGGLW